MCGIAGVLDFQSNKPSQKQVQDFVGSMSHRGPDGTGFLFRQMLFFWDEPFSHY